MRKENLKKRREGGHLERGEDRRVKATNHKPLNLPLLSRTSSYPLSSSTPKPAKWIPIWTFNPRISSCLTMLYTHPIEDFP